MKSGVISWIFPLVFILGLAGAVPIHGCTIIGAGRLATVDGSVITSHTDACENSRVHLVPARKHEKGSQAPVYYGLQDPQVPLLEYGEIIGYIPQVEQTFAYFHSGYSHMNEHQLALGESTTAQKKELQVDRETGKQIITVEQAMVFALQRCRTSREAVELITSLVEKYGFLPSCGSESETLCIADPQEAWILELFSVGPDWEPGTDLLGALWAAQRIPDDQVSIVPNWSIIKEIDLSRPQEFMASKNYMQVAIDHGWYDPNSGAPFIWQEAYTPLPREWGLSRLWLFYSMFASSYKEWPDKSLNKPYKNYDPYHQYLEPPSFYPFSAKPDRKLSVRDVIAFQRSVFEGTIYDMTADTDWLIPDGEGGMVKSPLTTPFPTPDMRNLLDITFRRNVAKGGYGMVAQLRSWLPDPVGGIYWYFLDNQYVSTYVPIYAGVQEISPLYSTFDPDKYDQNSTRWAVDFVDNLLYLKWQEAIKDVEAVRDPLEQSFFDQIPEVDEKAVRLLNQNPKKGKRYLTALTRARMEQTHRMYLDLRDELIVKYTNNRVRP
ncbi:MAG: C69 family dipeptidase [Candidatus Krumholzibacteriota bacterium]|nr:C69 family dipeptidase [Candidatus Krumholzibacteriota bacterium]